MDRQRVLAGVPGAEDRGQRARKDGAREQLTHGSEDVLFWDGRGLFRATPPAVAFVNGAGSGDAFVAGLVSGLERGDDPLDALRLAVGCGASNARLPVADVGPYAEVRDLAAAVIIRRVSRTCTVIQRIGRSCAPS